MEQFLWHKHGLWIWRSDLSRHPPRGWWHLWAVIYPVLALSSSHHTTFMNVTVTCLEPPYLLWKRWNKSTFIMEKKQLPKDWVCTSQESYFSSLERENETRSQSRDLLFSFHDKESKSHWVLWWSLATFYRSWESGCLECSLISLCLFSLP